MRIAELNDSDVSLLKSKFIEPKDKYPQDALHIFAGNGPAYIYIYDITIFNSKSIKQTDAKYYKPKIIYPTKIENILKCNQSETGGLARAF